MARTHLLTHHEIHAKFLACILVILFTPGVYAFQTNPCLPIRNRHHPFCVTSSTTTEATFTLPSFLSDDDDNNHNNYPSPLHHIHVRSVLSDDEVAHCRQLAYEYADETGCWNQPDQERHASYSTCDFPVEENAALTMYLDEIGFHDRIFTHLQDLYEIDDDDGGGCLSYLDLFCAHYQANDDDDETTNTKTTQTMDRLVAHRDGSLLSYTVLLNDPSEFEGGGTFYDALRDVEPHPPVLHPGGVIRPERAGDAVFHSGKVLHGADVVTKGKRTILVGFVDVADWIQRPGVLSRACRDWGRMDVANYRYKRQQEKTKNGSGWILNNSRWIDQSEGRSFLKGFVPAFPSVERRADPEFQRRKKLEAEDRLLRTIMLKEGERESSFDLFNGDITVY